MDFAYVFPGQASQYVGMGKDLYDSFPIAREMYNKAEKILDFDLKSISFEGPEEMLKQTNVTQPAIFVHSCIVHELLKEKNPVPSFVAGHSLGEYSALAASRSLSFETGLELVKLRGQLMQDAGEQNPGTMAAIIGLSPDELSDICKIAGKTGIVVPANYNSPGQIAVSGSLAGVKEVIVLAKTAGAKRAVELVVSGAFHSPLMAQATKKMVIALNNAEFKKPLCPIVPNVSAKPTRQPEEIREYLAKQLTNPVLWVASIEAIITRGVTKFYEIGPGKVLSGLIRRINRDTESISIDKAGDFSKFN